MKNVDYEIILSPEAAEEEELIISKSFYEEKQKGLGLNFVDEIDSIIQRIAKNPKQFPKYQRKI